MKGLPIILLTLFAVVLGFTSPAYTAEIKVGSFDGQRVFNESKKTKEAVKAVEDFGKSKEKLFEAEAANHEKELEKIRDEYQKQISVLSPEAKKEKEEQFKKKLEEFQKKRAAFSDEIRKKEAAVSKAFVEKLENVVKAIGKKEGFTLIVEKKGLFYSPDDFYPLDLTDRIIKEIDSQK